MNNKWAQDGGVLRLTRFHSTRYYFLLKWHNGACLLPPAGAGRCRVSASLLIPTQYQRRSISEVDAEELIWIGCIINAVIHSVKSTKYFFI